MKLDSSKARTELGWRPLLNLEIALDWTIRWYRQFQNGSDMDVETRAQIARFEQLA